MDIEVICTGDEVLTGKIVNSNFAYITQKLEDYGLAARRGVTVGDDREELTRAFRQAGERADVVIVNGGLGPTVDDLSQEIAAAVAGVGLVLNEEWMERMEAFFRRVGRTMPPNNRKQAMLPAGAEVIDNPIGTACGFGVNIGKAVFYFTPGVPRELMRMMEEQLLPRILARAGSKSVIVLKRFHSYGLGESHVDQMLGDLESMVPDGTLKLGFRAHYPQLETKLTVRAADMDEAQRKLAPVIAEVEKRIGNFIVARDGETHEGVIQASMLKRSATLALVEDFTGGQLAARLATVPGMERYFLRGVVTPTEQSKAAAFTLRGVTLEPIPSYEMAEAMAEAVRKQVGCTHGLAVLVGLDKKESQGGNHSGTVCIAISENGNIVARRSRLTGSYDWIRLGAVEMGMDSLRRHLQGLPIKEATDFERKAT
ncbi:MAG: CinA family nicotinamide mononucleotide deamidase-related protein [Candidatus Lambdaproteobacteria bacterium]|nr:CinA family nicotinamide mononucleotide deamidase-related protein [Candidatus Lambdaproteobacteria bacterium]